MTDAAPLFHLVPLTPWRAAKEGGGTTYEPTTYGQDGFVHLTLEADFLLGVGNQFYKEDQDEWRVYALFHRPNRLRVLAWQ